MARIYFEDFRLLVVRHVKEMEAEMAESHSPEWFLLGYLRRIAKAAEEPVSPNRVEGSLRSLIRFYVDNVEEASDPGRRCTLIYEAYRKTLRENRERE
ncbi:MAG: hypothetical protein P8126_10775 [Gammaproteobacteria bacterium]